MDHVLGFIYYPYKVTEIVYNGNITLFYEDFSGKCHWPFKTKKRNLQYIKDLQTRVTPVRLIFDWGTVSIWTEDRILWCRGFDQKLLLIDDIPPSKRSGGKPYSPGTVFLLGEGRKMKADTVHPPVPTSLDYTMQYGEDNSPQSIHYTAFLKRYLKGEI